MTVPMLTKTAMENTTAAVSNDQSIGVALNRGQKVDWPRGTNAIKVTIDGKPNIQPKANVDTLKGAGVATAVEFGVVPNDSKGRPDRSKFQPIKTEPAAATTVAAVADAQPVKSAAAELTATETENLRQAEQVIERGLPMFVKVGMALATIRDQKLYRAQHKTFADYCQTRWGWGPRTAYHYIESAKAVKSLTPECEPLVHTERAARALAGVPEEQRAAVVTKAAKAGAVTAKSIAAAHRPQIEAEPNLLSVGGEGQLQPTIAAAKSVTGDDSSAKVNEVSADQWMISSKALSSAASSLVNIPEYSLPEPTETQAMAITDGIHMLLMESARLLPRLIARLDVVAPEKAKVLRERCENLSGLLCTAATQSNQTAGPPSLPATVTKAPTTTVPKSKAAKACPKAGEKVSIRFLNGRYDRYAAATLEKLEFVEELEGESGIRSFKVLRDLPDAGDYKRLRDEAFTVTVADAVANAYDELVALRDELQSRYENMPEQFQSGEKGSDLEYAIEQLDGADSPPAVPGTVAADKILVLPEAGTSRPARRTNACAQLQTVLTHLESFKGDRAKDAAEFVAEIETMICAAGDTEFPGMF